MVNRSLLLTVLICSIIFVTGCMNPSQQRGANQGSPSESVVLVQSAINRYIEDHQVLPILTFDQQTELYERYRIDMQKLLSMDYLSYAPVHSFENGGTNFFVVVNPDENPEVKMLDIVTIQSAGEVEQAVVAFYQQHNTLPLGEEVASGWYQLDTDRLSNRLPQARSVFSGQTLDWLVNEQGRIVIDYAIDIMTLVQREEIADIDPELDLRQYLVEHSYFVPAKSAPYYWENNQPIISQ